jgi:hypothetical protein
VAASRHATFSRTLNARAVSLCHDHAASLLLRRQSGHGPQTAVTAGVEEQRDLGDSLAAFTRVCRTNMVGECIAVAGS